MLTTTLEIAVDPEQAVEVRGIGLRNDGPIARTLELTSYLELVLGSAQADAAHPAYSKMFVQTSLEDGVLLAWRRKKESADQDIWVAHAVVVDGQETFARQFETDRARFIGRGGSLRLPAATAAGQQLSGTVGTVLDPIFSMRAGLAVGAGETRRVAFVTAVAASRDEVQVLIRSYLDPASCAGVFARARNKPPRGRDGVDPASAQASPYQRLAGALVYDDPSLRAAPNAIAKGEGGAPVLWAEGISGDLPIVLARVGRVSETALVEDLLKAQGFWREKQLPADLVVLNVADGQRADAVEMALKDAAPSNGQNDNSQGSVFLLRADRLDVKFRDGLLASARIVLDGSDGGLARQPAVTVQMVGEACAQSPHVPTPPRGGKPAFMPQPANLDFWNGLGGFTKDGREYVTVLHEGSSTPAPWSHVVANSGFGFMTTTTGGGYCWVINSQQNQITRWSNDTVCDPLGDVLLLRDQEDGVFWSATAAPVRAGGATYVARFGPGYARFDANVHGIESELVQCVAASDPVKLSRLRLHNRSQRPRRIAVAGVATWRLGPIGSDPRPTTLVETDPVRSASFARNAWREEFTRAVAFIVCTADGATPTSDGNLRSAVVTVVDLAPDASVDLVFLLGEGGDRAAATRLV
ncbi:MAG: GH36-type glycosyl hydrolase domain-containing protein, partial [Rhodanobacteraceae bacterium]